MTYIRKEERKTMLSEILGILNIAGYVVIAIYALRMWLFVIVTHKNKIVDTFKSESVNTDHFVSVLVPARNEEKVVGRLLDSLSKTEYPHEKLEIIVLNDASTDKTSQIIHEWASQYSFIKAIDRKHGGVGKGDVMNQGVRESKGDIIITFDADYIAAPDTIPRLVRWFQDEKIWLVQGRIGVVNKDENILTKVVYTQRCGGFLCDLYARDILHASPQYGGTVGGFRRALINKVGWWEPRVFTMDTDLTCRTLIAGFKVKYDVTVNALEEAPNRLKVYYKQRYRWIRGRTVCALKYARKFLTSSNLSLQEKIDGAIWVSARFTAVFVMFSLACRIIRAFIFPIPFGFPEHWSLVYITFALGAFVSKSMIGLLRAKGWRKYSKYILFNIIGCYPMVFLITPKAYLDILLHKPLNWVKTERSGVET
jgi:cellulose synthase/poly-beta-1,6-N-acetylglucosamine synthase-like glycosyltransferase